MWQSNRVLQKEQSDLYAIERKLVQMLPKVQEASNSLKVEELHLKSQAVNHTLSQENPPSLNVNIESAGLSESIIIPDVQINQQEIDLELFVNKMQPFDVEIDSD